MKKLSEFGFVNLAEKYLLLLLGGIALFDEEVFKTNFTINHDYTWYNNVNQEYADYTLKIYNLFEIFSYFKDKTQRTDQLIDFTLKHQHPYWIKPLVNKIIQNIDKFPVSIMRVIEVRRDFIQKMILKNKREFSWRMPSAFTNHPKLHAFLQKNKEETYLNDFQDKRHAKNFIRKFNGFQRGWSVEMERTGSDWSSEVTINKTKQQFNQEDKIIKEMETELNQLDKILKMRKHQ
jgi:hypothetical protein